METSEILNALNFQSQVLISWDLKSLLVTGDPEILRSSSFHMVRKNPVLNGLLASIHT